MSNYPNRYQVAMGAHSDSTSTSPAWFVGDFEHLSVSIVTSNTTSSSTFILQVSNADGLQVEDLGGPSQSTSWSALTVVLKGSLNVAPQVGLGFFSLDPVNYRWIRSTTSADPQTASRGTVIFVGTRF